MEVGDRQATVAKIQKGEAVYWVGDGHGDYRFATLSVPHWADQIRAVAHRQLVVQCHCLETGHTRLLAHAAVPSCPVDPNWGEDDKPATGPKQRQTMPLATALLHNASPLAPKFINAGSDFKVRQISEFETINNAESAQENLELNIGLGKMGDLRAAMGQLA